MSEFKTSSRFLQIVQTVAYLKSGGPITDEWTRLHTEHIREYRQACDDFAIIQEDIEDTEFRTAALTVETILNQLCTDMCYSKPLHIERYYEMMVAMEIMCQSFITECDMLECMDALGF